MSNLQERIAELQAEGNQLANECAEIRAGIQEGQQMLAERSHRMVQINGGIAELQRLLNPEPKPEKSAPQSPPEGASRATPKSAPRSAAKPAPTPPADAPTE